MTSFTTLIRKWSDFGHDATACWSTDPRTPICYGDHKILCVRGFLDLQEAHNYAMDQVEILQRRKDGKKLPSSKTNYSGADCHYSWRSSSDNQIKYEISERTRAKEEQIEIIKRL